MLGSAPWRQRNPVPPLPHNSKNLLLPIAALICHLTMSLASEALSGFQKGQAYDQNRPSYPPQVVAKLLQALHIEGVAGAEVLDLAAGTGKFTELLAKRDEQFQITAVEPHDDMRNELEKKQLPKVNVLNGLATQIPLPDESVDAVIIAQAFHWFATQDALKELHRVIRLAGVLGLVWNIEDYNQTQEATKTTNWEAKLNEFIWTFKDEAPRFRNSQWRGIFDNQIKSTPFTITAFASPLFSLPLGEDEVKWTVWLTKEKIWNRFSTLSQIAILEGEALKNARKVFDEALAGEDVETNENGEVALHGATYLYWTSRVPDVPIGSGGE
ncbi:hypothetical protein FKW77_004952 [Venturia effusa]|uniref:Methyltransferase type 11 domain-containing protein n=1 Tax=Venturia effusa TaxID=50376 RepID=A0A517KWA8_9PEZI|nr:hypothetical protein FKW77_004952 [Venturia effusa]